MIATISASCSSPRSMPSIDVPTCSARSVTFSPRAVAAWRQFIRSDIGISLRQELQGSWHRYCTFARRATDDVKQALCRHAVARPMKDRAAMYARWIRISLLLVGLGALPAAAQTCKPAIADSDLVVPPNLQMSINATLPPQQFGAEKGELQGRNVELMREIAHRLCVPLDLIRMDFPPMLPALQAARFDGINTGMFWTHARCKIAYTVPYAQPTISLTVTKDSAL